MVATCPILPDQLTSLSASVAGSPHARYTYQYNDANQRVRMELASGDYWSYGYDKMGQVRYAAKYQSGGAGLPGYAFGLPFVDGFTYDDIGNRTSAIGGDTDLTSSYFADAGASGANGANALNQPGSRSVPRMLAVRGVAETDASVTVDGQNVNGRVGEYFYGETSVDDDLAHWLAVEVEGRLSGGGYQGSDRVAREIDEQFVAPNPENFVYDADGNLTSDGRWSYTWDAENRLTGMATLASAVSVGAPDYRLAFRYDARGRMFERKLYRDNLLESTERYLWNGYNQIAQFDDAGAMQQSYLWGLDLSGSMQGAGGVGGLLSVTDGASGTTAYPFYDGNGNVMGYVDAADGRKVATFEYGPFGEPLRATGPLADGLTYRFSTKPTDDVTRHVHYELRTYDPLNGRWLSRDPIGENGGLNLYAFVGNDAVNGWDVLGMCTLGDVSGFAVMSINYVDRFGDTDAVFLRKQGIFHAAIFMAFVYSSTPTPSAKSQNVSSAIEGLIGSGITITMNQTLSNRFGSPDMTDTVAGWNNVIKNQWLTRVFARNLGPVRIKVEAEWQKCVKSLCFWTRMAKQKGEYTQMLRKGFNEINHADIQNVIRSAERALTQ